MTEVGEKPFLLSVRVAEIIAEHRKEMPLVEQIRRSDPYMQGIMTREGPRWYRRRTSESDP